MEVIYKYKSEVYVLTLPMTKIHKVEGDHVQIYLDDHEADQISQARAVAEMGDSEMRAKYND
jgi:hypothetical protein